MKKIKFISAIALTMVMASCDNYDLPNPPGQTNPEPDGYFENSGLVLTQAETALNLVSLNEANEFAKVATITELVNFPDTYTLSIDMQVSGNDSFSNFTTIGTTIDGDAVTVNPDFLNGAIQEVMTKQPGTYDVYTRFVAYAERGTTRMRLGGINATYLPATYNVTTLNPEKVMEQSYYIVGDFCNWDVKKAIKMNNTAGNVSVYDNPEFAIKLSVPADKTLSWKILPASAYEAGSLDGAFGCTPAEGGLSGKLISAAGKDNAGVIELLGDVLVTINVELDSYTVNYAFEVLYPLSGTTLTKPTTALMLYTDNYINYSGVSVINQQWILAGQPDQNGDVIFRQDPDTEAEVSEDGLSQTGLLTSASDAKRIRAPFKGNSLYWVDVNLVQLTYSITALRTLSVIGSGNGWDLATAAELTPSKDFKVWTASDVEIGDEFKINANGAWAIGFSGTSIDDVTGKFVYQVNKQDGGDNLKCSAPGKYNVTVDFSTFPYIVTLSK